MKIKCPICGVENLEGMVYCVGCHNKLPLQAEQPSVEQKQPIAQKDVMEKPSSERRNGIKHIDLENNFIQMEEPSWERRNEIGFLGGLLLTVKQLLLHPVRFFCKMSTIGGLRDPLLFGLITSSLGDIIKLGCFVLTVNSLWGKTGPYGFFISNPRFLLFSLVLIPIILVIRIFITAFFFNLSLWLVGAREGFEATFRVVAYTEAVNLLAVFWIPVVLLALILSRTLPAQPILPFKIIVLSLAIIMIVIWLIKVLLYTIGFKFTHNIATSQVILGILIYVILMSSISYVISKNRPKRRIFPLLQKSSIQEEGRKDILRKNLLK